VLSPGGFQAWRGGSREPKTIWFSGVLQTRRAGRGCRTGATRDEGCTLGFDSPQSKGRVPRPLNASGIVLRSDNDKIIVYHGIALHAKPFRNEFLLCLPGVHKDHVGIAMARAATILLYTSQAPARYFVEPGIPHPHRMGSRKKSSAPRFPRPMP
jgi:hypothetical protein